MTSILLADDDEMTVRLIEHKLKQSGFDVISATDGKTAYDLVQTDRPDLVVLDGMMPRMDGFEVLRRLKDVPETKAIPVIMLTARKKEEDIVNALSLGAADYIVKPFIPAELVVRIQRIVAGAD